VAALVLTEEQELLQQTARQLVSERSPVSELRRLRDTKDPTGFSRPLWQEAAELGWAGIVYPEELGGTGLGYAELGLVLEECGRTLMAHPFLSSVLLAGNAILLGGSDAQRKDVLPAVARGERILALAFQEAGRYDPFRVHTRAEPTADGFRMSGEKVFVLDGHVADQLVVLARSAGDVRDRAGLSLFLVDARARGVAIERTFMVDSRNAASVRLRDVEVDRSAAIGAPGQGGELLERVLDRAAIGLAAEMLGTLEQAFQTTLDYLKERRQFGVPIGSFQALKHRAAALFCEVELCKSAVLESLRALDEQRPDVPRLASLVKARLSESILAIANEAIQMHGGVGMTDEYDIGFYLKRARAAATTLGDASFHRDRYARLSGY
jgi:alkylation response protein AidB-like acyl-CoA dehydrogenase